MKIKELADREVLNKLVIYSLPTIAGIPTLIKERIQKWFKKETKDPDTEKQSLISEIKEYIGMTAFFFGILEVIAEERTKEHEAIVKEAAEKGIKIY